MVGQSAVTLGLLISLWSVIQPAAATAQQQLVSIRDSARVRIVELARGYARDLPRWQIAKEPDLVVGEIEGEAPYLLTYLAGASIASDGTLAVADVMSSEVRFFDAKGRFLDFTGGKGRGPGEFSIIHHMVRTADDTLVVWDERGGRITWIGPDRTTARVEPRPGPVVYHIGAVLGSGSRVMPIYPDPIPRAVEGVLWRPNGRIAYVDQSTGRIDTLGVFLGGEGAGGGMFAGPGRRNTLFATNGHVSKFATGDNQSFDLVLYEVRDPATPVREAIHIRETFPPGPVSDRFVRGWQEEMRSAWRGHPMEERALREIESPVLAETLPAFESIVLDNFGYLWVERFRPDRRAPRTATVFNELGIPVAQTEYPASLEILEIGADYVLGAFTDDLDVVSARKYRLTRAGRR